MRLADYNFELPEELIAQEPLQVRESSRMLVVDRAKNEFTDCHFIDLLKFLHPGDVLVINNTKVFPARLNGSLETGGKVEVFLTRQRSEMVWEALAKPGKRLKPGKRIRFGEELSCEVVEKQDDGTVIVEFACGGDFDSALENIGRTPLPHYIRRDESVADRDRERYQTVFAKERGAIAAPTAGLHFTPELLAQIKDMGVEIVEVTLHVGYGTFAPVRADDLSQHRVLPEECEVAKETADVVNRAKTEGRRVIAVGTTSTRALEGFAEGRGRIGHGRKMADLTITPGYDFKIVDGLLTNFHLPESSLLILVSTFGGHELIMSAYRHAVEQKYRFYSYGDCTLIV